MSTSVVYRELYLLYLFLFPEIVSLSLSRATTGPLHCSSICPSAIVLALCYGTVLCGPGQPCWLCEMKLGSLCVVTTSTLVIMHHLWKGFCELNFAFVLICICLPRANHQAV